MKTRETSLWQWAKSAFKADLGPNHVVRIEDHANVGTPDVNGRTGGVDFWMELKVGECTEEGVVADLTPEQAQFLRVRRSAGGQAFLFLQVGEYRYLIPGLSSVIIDLAAKVPVNITRLHGTYLVRGKQEFIRLIAQRSDVRR